jgi:FixJ family two-component response regulator
MVNDVPLLAVVDDDADVRVALTRLVSSAGFAVETFASGAEFLRSVTDHEPDCVVLDLHMPEMSGFDVQGALASGHATVPVVVITGHDTPESRARAVRLGAKGYLCKPVNDEALLAAIGTAIGGESR